MSEKKYKAAIYLRLSKEDGDKEESYSISNQRDLAMDYINSQPDISLECEMIDDGCTGSNFERPAFQKMIDKALKGKINCVIVKDLSRFARNYAGSGYYLEKLFPSIGVRFISINDNIDYKVDNSANARLIMAFKNVLNDSYIHDISVKIRSQFEIKRRKGEYIGPFVVYGYLKSAEDKHKLAVDEEAAKIIKDIFNQRIQGISANAIAERLNLLGVPSPAEYKKLCGSKFSANLQKKHEAKWTAKAVIRILTNEIYTGTLIQGKRTTVNYKVKKIIQKEECEWSVIKNAHEAIITDEQFNTVQELIKRDTRVKPGKKEPYLFSGFLFCPDCKSPLVRRPVRDKDRVYTYYMCSTKKLGLGCSSHRINEELLYSVVLESINIYCKNVLVLSNKLNAISFDEIKEKQIERIENSMKNKHSLISDLERTLTVVKNKYVKNLETKEAYDEICEDIRLEINGLKAEIEALTAEKEKSFDDYNKNTLWLKSFKEYENITELNRPMLAQLIDKIYVYEDKRIEIEFRYKDEYERLAELINANNNSDKREAV